VSAAAASNSYFLLMRMAPSSHVTIVGLAVSLLLPFLSIAFAIYMDKPLWIYPICSCKAFGFAYNGFGISAAFGSGGWLVRSLFLFSDILTLPAFCWLALSHIYGRTTNWKRDIAISLGICIGAGCLDIWFISPFLAHIIQK
jgi:hypothetical protein